MEKDIGGSRSPVASFYFSVKSPVCRVGQLISGLRRLATLDTDKQELGSISVPLIYLPCFALCGAGLFVFPPDKAWVETLSISII